MPSEHRRAARAIVGAMRQTGREAVHRHGRRNVRAEIVNLSPLLLDVLGEDLTLGDDDVDFSQDVERYAATEGLAVGDELALLEAEVGEWIATTVISDAAVRGVPSSGPSGSVAPATLTAEGIVRLSHAPGDPAHPVAVEDADPRNTNARVPTAHTHPQSDVTGLAASLAGKVDTTDTRLSDARTPTAHHTTHEPGGSDAMAVDAAAATGSLRTLGTGAQQATAGNDARLSNARTPTGAAGGDVAGSTYPNLTVVTINGRAVSAVVFTDDARLTNARTPTAHASSHAAAGSDPVTPAAIGAPTVQDPLGWGFPRTWVGHAPTTTGNVGGANGARFTRWLGGATLVKVRLWLGASSGNIDVGVYSSTGSGSAAVPGARKASTGSMASPGTSAQDITLAVVVNNGDWIAVAADNTTVTFGQIAEGGGAGMGLGEAMGVNSGCFPLPSTAPALTTQAAGIAAIGLTS